jgi:hypothetical protein
LSVRSLDALRQGLTTTAVTLTYGELLCYGKERRYIELACLSLSSYLSMTLTFVTGMDLANSVRAFFHARK